MSFASRVERLRREHCRAGDDELVVLTAADFMHGGAPSLARIFDRKGCELAQYDRLDGEELGDFRERVRGASQSLAGASRLVIGGMGSSGAGAALAASGLPRAAVSLPDAPLHASQIEAVELIKANRRVVLVCGRRWGKTTVIVTLTVDAVLSGKNVAVLAPTYRFIRPLQSAIIAALSHVPGVQINRTHGELTLAGGGSATFWSLDHTGRSLRGQGIDLVLVDEAAHDEGYLQETLEAAIGPATLDRAGKIVLASTPAGLEGAFYEAANLSEKGYVTFHAPTSANPHLPVEEIAYLRSTMRAELASQELDALFLDTGGASIFPLHLMLDDGEPHADDGFTVDYVGVCIDSASGKGGEGRDGTAAAVFAVTLPNILKGDMAGANVVFLDWSIESLSQGGVPAWMQHVREMTMGWFYRLKPLRGLPKAHIEPMANAYSIIETARTCGLNPVEIETSYVAMGKDGRAVHVEPHFAGSRVRIGRHALDKRTNYRGVTANHLVRQVTGFKTFDKDAYKREDDLLDACVYSVLISLGDGVAQRWSRLKRAAA
jgi:hypothetical protein